MSSRKRRRQAARDRRRRLRGRGGAGVLLAAMTLAAGAALAQERPADRETRDTRAAAAVGKLEQGDRGDAVVAVQRRLRLDADGVFGSATRHAVQRFQRRHELTPDGVVGPMTASALKLRLRGSSAREADRRSLTGVSSSKLDRIARCESGGDPTAVSSSGRYRGKYQFSRATWRAMGGHGDPAKASEAEQDRRAATLLARSGPSPWPNCA